LSKDFVVHKVSKGRSHQNSSMMLLLKYN